MNKPCDVCGTAFEALRSAKYCSESCRKQRYRERFGGEYQKKGRQKRRSAGLCGVCSNPSLPGYSLCKKHKDYARASEVARYRRRRQQGLCGQCGKPSGEKSICMKCFTNQSQRERRNRRHLRSKVFRKYGGEYCANCGEARQECLTLDHINSDGSVEDRKLGWGRQGSPLNYLPQLRKLLKEPVRPDLRVLCYNCNVSAFRNRGEPTPAPVESTHETDDNDVSRMFLLEAVS